MIIAAQTCDLLCTRMAQSVVALTGIAMIAAIWLLASRWRAIAVNRARRQAGLRPLRWRTIRATGLAGSELSSHDAHDAILDERELRRQIEWEKAQHYNEILVHGSGRSRRFCKEHDRFCLIGDGGPHPPGGHGNPLAPPEFHLP
jgi:hypothetical protein